MLMWQSLSMKPESKQVNAATAGGSERHKTVIARLEDADYEGHSLSTEIAHALNQQNLTAIER